MAKKPTTKKTPAEKKPTLDIKDEMYWSDRKNFGWLEGLDPDLAGTFSPLVAMKWFSVVPDNSGLADYYILMTNELLNVGFWDLYKHPELQWKLMCAAGAGSSLRHGWVNMASKKKTVSKIDNVLLSLYPNINDDELNLLKSKFTIDTFKELLKDMGMSDADIKPLVEEFKKKHG